MNNLTYFNIFRSKSYYEFKVKKKKENKYRINKQTLLYRKAKDFAMFCAQSNRQKMVIINNI